MAFAVATVLTNLGKAILTNRLKGTGTEPNYLAVGSGAHDGAGRTAAVTDTALTTQYGSRILGTSTVETITTTGDTYKVVATINATSSVALDEAGLFDAATGGNMFLSGTFAPINLNNNDRYIGEYTVQQA